MQLDLRGRFSVTLASRAFSRSLDPLRSLTLAIRVIASQRLRSATAAARTATLGRIAGRPSLA